MIDLAEERKLDNGGEDDDDGDDNDDNMVFEHISLRLGIKTEIS